MRDWRARSSIFPNSARLYGERWPISQPEWPYDTSVMGRMQNSRVRNIAPRGPCAPGQIERPSEEGDGEIPMNRINTLRAALVALLPLAAIALASPAPAQSPSASPAPAASPSPTPAPTPSATPVPPPAETKSPE